MTERRVHVDDPTVTCEPETNTLAAVSDAIEATDVTLNRDDPMDVPKASRVSDGSLAKIKQNPFRALGHNTSMIPLASLGYPRP